MWSIFLASSILAVILLYVPGFMLLKSMSLDLVICLCASPALSIAFFSILELLLNVTGISSNALSVGLFASSLLILVTLASHFILAKRKPQLDNFDHGKTVGVFNKSDLLLLMLYLGIGLFAAFFFIVMPLDGPESFFQGWDNLHHLGDTKAFIDSADWNPLFSSRYIPGDAAPCGVSRSFYPSAYHVLCAAIATLVGAGVPTVINVVNTVLVGLVFASSMFMLFRTLFKRNDVIALGSLFALGVPACPWDYLIYGPLFPNLLSMVLVPICMAFFIIFMRALASGSTINIVKHAICLTFSLIAVVFAHPNGVFTLVLILAPYLSAWIWNELKTRGRTSATLVFSQVIYWGFILIFWCLCREVPLLNNIVNVRWPSIVDLPTAISNCIFLNFFNHPSQPLVALFLVIGIANLLRDGKGNRWLIVSYLLASFVYIVDASTDGEFKQIVSGYWYTDYHRTAAIVALMVIVIAAYGASVALRFITAQMKAFSSSRGNGCSNCVIRSMSFMFGLMVFMLTYFDVFSIFGIEVYTPFEYQKQEFANQYNYELVYYDVLTAREQEFCEKAMSIIPDGARVLNSPNDGSVFMYPLYGANIYYRGCTVPSPDSEYECSKQIRLHLNDLPDSPAVQEAVKQIGADYLIQLDHGENPAEFRISYWGYSPEDWIGVNSVDETIPGFELIMSDGDMRLYKIIN